MYITLRDELLVHKFYNLIENNEIDKKTLSKCTKLDDHESLLLYGFKTVSVPECLYKKLKDA